MTYYAFHNTLQSVIGSFRCRDTKALANGERVRRFLAIELAARTRLRRLEAATSLHDLETIPGNRLEALRADRMGQHSIRINGQYRICFVWRNGKAEDVEIVDYH